MLVRCVIADSVTPGEISCPHAHLHSMTRQLALVAEGRGIGLVGGEYLVVETFSPENEGLAGSSVVEKNLDRLTLFIGAIWLIAIVGTGLLVKING